MARIVAQRLGTALGQYAGWRSTFWAVSVIGVIAAIAQWVWLPKDIAMDKANLDNLRRMASAGQKDRIRLFMDYSRGFDDDEVPDPYYGLGHGFDLVLDMVEDAAQGLVGDLKKKLGRK